MARRTKIVCTLGPSVDDEASLRALLGAGMDVARFNFSHGSHDEHRARMERLRKVRGELDSPCAMLLDTRGPEIRTGRLAGGRPVELAAGSRIVLTERAVEGTPQLVSQSCPGLAAAVGAGTSILVDDGLLELEVEGVDGTDIRCIVRNTGMLGERKSVNVPGAALPLPALTDQDRADLLFGIGQDIDFVAASFVRDADGVRAVRRFLDGHGGEGIRIVAKIECSEAVENFDAILEAADGVMVARGDLGVELPAEAIPNTQRRIVEKCICAKRPVIIATQMLYSMVKSPRPTRAEVSDVASAIYERVDAVMLSDETAMGDFPVESVETMARIAREIERDETHFKPMIDMDMVSVNHEITAQLARSAVRASTNLPIKYVVLDTKTGRTGRYLAAFRGQKTVMAVCYQLHAQRILALSYGVVPILRNQELKDRYHFLIDALEVIEQHQKLDGQDLLAIVGGSFGPDGGASYVEIANILNIRKRNEEIVAAQKS